MIELKKKIRENLSNEFVITINNISSLRGEVSMIGQFIKSLMKLIENDIISLNIYSKFFFNFDNAKNDIDSSILKVFFNHEEMKREIKDKPSYLIYYELC